MVDLMQGQRFLSNVIREKFNSVKGSQGLIFLCEEAKFQLILASRGLIH